MVIFKHRTRVALSFCDWCLYKTRHPGAAITSAHANHSTRAINRTLYRHFTYSSATSFIGLIKLYT